MPALPGTSSGFAAIALALVSGCMAPYEVRPLLEKREIGEDFVYESAEERDAHPGRYFYDVPETMFGPFPRVMIEPRIRVEIADNLDMDDTSADTAARALLRTRILLDSGRFYERVNYRLEFQDSQEAFSGSEETAQDRLDLRQGYLFIAMPRSVWGLKLGRQEIDLGTGRILGADWDDNIDPTFDAVRFVTANRWGRFEPRQWTWRLDVLAASPVAVVDDDWNTRHDEPNVAGLYYSDRRNFPFRLSGGVFTTVTRKSSPGELGGRDRDVITTISGAVVGRRFGRARGWHLDAEAAVQFGHKGPDRHLAALASLQVSYVFPTPLGLSVGVGIETASGDADSGDGRSGTFVPLFPGDLRERLGALSLVGLSNVEVLSLNVSIEPLSMAPDFRLVAALRRLRLDEAAAGWTGPRGDPVAISGPDLGSELDVFARFRFTTVAGKEVWVEGGTALFEPAGDLPSTSGPVQKLYLQTSFRF